MRQITAAIPFPKPRIQIIQQGPRRKGFGDLLRHGQVLHKTGARCLDTAVHLELLNYLETGGIGDSDIDGNIGPASSDIFEPSQDRAGLEKKLGGDLGFDPGRAGI